MVVDSKNTFWAIIFVSKYFDLSYLGKYLDLNHLSHWKLNLPKFKPVVTYK